MNKFALIGLAAVSALMIGCSSTQCRDGVACADGAATCCGSCQSDKECTCGSCGTDAKSCCGTCKGEGDKSECCGNCAGEAHGHEHGDGHAHACPNCKDGQKCAKCAA